MSTLEFEQQLTRIRPTLSEFTKRFTSNQDDSMDLVQDTLFKALKYRDKFKENTNLNGWLFTIMRNTFINNYRKAKRSQIITNSEKNSYFLHTEDTHTFSKPDAHYEYSDTWKQVNSLREELLLPFKMHLSGYKYDEIATHLNIPLGTVKNRIFHARKELQEKLVGY